MRYGLDRHLDAEIAARDHDAVGGLDDRIQLGERLVLLDLGDHGNALSALRDEVLHARHVGDGAHERDRHVVDAVLEPEGEILEVALRHRWDVEYAVAIGDALRGTQIAAHLDGGLDVVGTLAGHAQRDLTVLQVDAFPHLDVGRKRAVARAHSLARTVYGLRGDDQPVTPFESYAADVAGVRAGAHLGPGQVLEDGRVDAQLGRDLARGADHRGVLLRRAVRKVEAQHVGAREKERTKNCGLSRRRSDGRDDLRAFMRYDCHETCEACAPRPAGSCAALSALKPSS